MKDGKYFNSIYCDYLAGSSIPDLSEKYNIPRSSIRYDLLKTGVSLRTRKESLGLDSAKLKISKVHKGRKRTFTKEHCKNISVARKEKVDFSGYRITSQGYVELTRGDYCGKLLHIIIAEALLGRKLYENEVVHHKDINKTNNDPDNLQIMDKKEHNSLHAKIFYKNRKRNNLGQFK